MNEVRRARIHCDIDIVAAVRERLDKIRDDEERGRTDSKFGIEVNECAIDYLSEASHCCLVLIDRLQRAKQC